MRSWVWGFWGARGLHSKAPSCGVWSFRPWDNPNPLRLYCDNGKENGNHNLGFRL